MIIWRGKQENLNFFMTWKIFPKNELKERGIHLLMVEFCSIPLQCVCSSGVGGLVGRYCSGMLVGILCYAAITYGLKLLI